MSATTKHPTKAKGMNFTTRKRISSAITSIVMIAIALICAIPLWYIVINTFKTIPDMSSNPLGLPKQWTFDNYTHAFATVPILRSLWNTLIVTFFGVAIQVIVGALAAYGMILRKSRFTAIIGTILMVAFVVPAQSTLIPLYRMEAQTHIVNTLGGLVLIYLGGCVFCYFLIVGYMRSLPFELIEVARIDGLIDMIWQEMGCAGGVVMSGDDASALAALCSHEAQVEPDLTLLGLGMLERLNRRR